MLTETWCQSGQLPPEVQLLQTVQALCVFLWYDPDQDKWSENAQITGFDIWSPESLGTGLVIFEMQQPKAQLCSPAQAISLTGGSFSS